jgi:hypothetical protein
MRFGDLQIGEELKFGFYNKLSSSLQLRRLNQIMISDSGHEMDALGHAGEEGRYRLRKSTVSCQISVNPYVSEWGNPVRVMSYDPYPSEVG